MAQGQGGRMRAHRTPAGLPRAVNLMVARIARCPLARLRESSYPRQHPTSEGRARQDRLVKKRKRTISSCDDKALERVLPTRLGR
jgi:hypothetical protein